ncbi:DUF397 domain-containing protein [Streptomyces xiamenensis]|uniref:DUF397 domain-containing protein n=1 Tax=Streptomyces xiamenensis TaxID=408015 RepID=UPI0036E82FAF
MKNELDAQLAGATWRSASSGGQTCVEVAALRSAVAVRDSKDPGGPVLVVRPEDFGVFLTGVKSGQMYHP